MQSPREAQIERVLAEMAAERFSFQREIDAKVEAVREGHRAQETPVDLSPSSTNGQPPVPVDLSPRRPPTVVVSGARRGNSMATDDVFWESGTT